MTNSEKKEFKSFMIEKRIYLLFCNTYHKHKFSINPSLIENYLDSVKAENVILQAFTYHHLKHGKDFWLGIHEDWLTVLDNQRGNRSEMDMMDRFGLEEIELVGRNASSGLPKNTCSLNLRNGNILSLNKEQSMMVIKKLSTKMLLTRSRKTTDVVLIFNRVKGVDLKTRSSREKNSLQVNNIDMAEHLLDLLELDTDKDYFQLHCELLTETKDMILFKLTK